MTSTDWERKALGHLAQKGLKPRVIVDIGAAYGEWGVQASNTFWGAEFHLIDALQENLPHLDYICSKQPTVSCHLAALGPQAGHGVLNLSDNLADVRVLDLKARSPACRDIEITCLDDMIGSAVLPRPDFLRIDVPGSELSILRGAARSLPAVEVVWTATTLYRFMPWYNVAHETIQFLAERGFQLFDVGRTIQRPFDADLAQLDFIFFAGTSPLIVDNRWY
jgi:FkbM family methyltransferase